jgi:hypothetical protein
MDLLLLHRLGALGKAIERGREILAKGVEDPVVYHTLIRASAEAGFVPAAEGLVLQAKTKFPKQEAFFTEALEKAELKSPAAQAAKRPG